MDTLKIAANLCKETTAEAVMEWVRNFNALGQNVNPIELINEMNKNGRNIKVSYSYEAGDAGGRVEMAVDGGDPILRFEFDMYNISDVNPKAALKAAVDAALEYGRKKKKPARCGRKKWKKSDIALVRETVQSNSMTAEELGTMLNRTPSAIRTMRSRILRGKI